MQKAKGINLLKNDNIMKYSAEKQIIAFIHKLFPSLDYDEGSLVIYASFVSGANTLFFKQNTSYSQEEQLHSSVTPLLCFRRN